MSERSSRGRVSREGGTLDSILRELASVAELIIYLFHLTRRTLVNGAPCVGVGMDGGIVIVVQSR